MGEPAGGGQTGIPGVRILLFPPFLKPRYHPASLSSAQLDRFFVTGENRVTAVTVVTLARHETGPAQ